MIKAHFLNGSLCLVCSMSRSRFQDVSSLVEVQRNSLKLAELDQSLMLGRHAMHVLEQHSAAKKRSIGVLIPCVLIYHT